MSNQVTTESFLRKMREIDPDMQLKAASERPSRYIEIPGDDLRNLLSDRTFFPRGCWGFIGSKGQGYAQTMNWVTELDEILNGQWDVVLRTLKDRDAYGLTLYPRGRDESGRTNQGGTPPGARRAPRG